MDVEETVKIDSKPAYRDIETEMGQVDYGYMINKQDEVITALQKLQQVLERYIHGQYSKEANVQEENITLPGFVTLLEQTKGTYLKHDQTASLNAISKVRESWLSVEGNVVAQSASVYSNSERDMVVANAMIAKQEYDNAAKIVDNMITYLAPLAQKTSYTYPGCCHDSNTGRTRGIACGWRITCFCKKSNVGKGGRWVWFGVIAGLLLSATLAVIVKFAFSSGAFGTNNFLLGGWTGVFAAVMLLYMSYWLHSNSNVKKWNAYIETKTQTALTTGRIVSLGILSFLAVFREGHRNRSIHYWDGQSN